MLAAADGLVDVEVVHGGAPPPPPPALAAASPPPLLVDLSSTATARVCDLRRRNGGRERERERDFDLRLALDRLVLEFWGVPFRRSFFKLFFFVFGLCFFLDGSFAFLHINTKGLFGTIQDLHPSRAWST